MTSHINGGSIHTLEQNGFQGSNLADKLILGWGIHWCYQYFDILKC